MAIFQDKDKNGKLIKTKDGRSWYFKVYKKDFLGNNKAYKSKKFLRRGEAEEAERIFLLKRDNPINKRFDSVARDYFNEMYKKRKESTVYCYENIYNKNILPYFKNISLSNINTLTINAWHDEMNKTQLKKSYKNKLNTVLKSILNHAIKNYGLDKNYADIVGCFEEVNDKVVKDNEKIRYITFDEWQRFISVVEEGLWKTFFILLYYTGMRKGEVQALTWQDIDFNNNEIIVNKTLSTKTKNSIGYKITNTKNCMNRKVAMNTILRNTLFEYKNQVKKFVDFNENWFVFGSSRFLPHITIDRHKDKYFKLCGVNKITIHEFRHSHVSLLINEYIKSSKEKNMKIDTAKFFLMLANRMGHTVAVMQKTYMHLFPTIQDEIVDLLNNL